MISLDSPQIAMRSVANTVGKFRVHVEPRRFWLSVAGGLIAFNAAGAVAAIRGKSIIEGSLSTTLVCRGV